MHVSAYLHRMIWLVGGLVAPACVGATACHCQISWTTGQLWHKTSRLVALPSYCTSCSLSLSILTSLLMPGSNCGSFGWLSC